MSPLTFNAPFDTPFYTGSALSSLVPGTYPISLNGRNYLASLKEQHGFSVQTIPLIRNQADTGNIPGEQSINPEDLWRRAQDNWTHGAGQLYLDRIDPDVLTFHSNRGSDDTRFNTSKGINCWNRWYLSLLPDTTQQLASVNTNLYLQVVASYLYASDNQSLKYTTDITGAGPASWTTVTGTPAAAIGSLASDGNNVWASFGASGIYQTTRGAASASSYTTGTVGLVAYLKGRLMAASGASIYNITAGGGAALPAALFTHGNADFSWVGFAEGQTAIYAAGFSGDKSLIYKTTIKTDGTALDAPTVAMELPDGEVVRSIQGYLGYLCIGTDKGMRFASADTSGNLTYGSYIPTTGPVYCFEPQDRFVWFGWTNFDTVSTGLGRVDLENFTATLTPAYASDLMVTGQGTVQSVVTLQSRRVFTIAGKGIYAESTNLVPTGTLDTGLMTFGLPDQKIGMYNDLRFSPIVGKIRSWVSADRGAFSLIGAVSDVTSPGSVMASFPIGQISAELFEIRLELNRATDTTKGPTLSRSTTRSYPAPSRNEVVQLPILLFERLTLGESTMSMDPEIELNNIRSMITGRRLVSFQLGAETKNAFVDDYQWFPSSMTDSNSWWNGVCVVKLKILNQ